MNDPNTNLPLTPLVFDYAKWESVNGLVAVAASSSDLAAAPNRPFLEATALSGGVNTPDLTGTAFRHCGYFIYASAVIARLDEDPTWSNKYRPYVDLLVRDIANPSASDAYFPVSRTFDWFKMQNQADSGPTANGPNTESSSESINANYALALWGDVTGNAT